MNPLVTVDELRRLMPRLSLAKAGEYAALLSVAMLEQEIVSKKRRCAFLAQLAHESEQLTRWVENLNYSAQRLTEVWPKRFPTVGSALPFAHDPKALAERVYGGRMGNTKPGDGFKYRGRFPLQATGREMYRKLSRALGIPELETDPDLFLSDKLVGLQASAWIFAVEKDCNTWADRLKLDGGAHDRGILIEICERINGGLNGLSDRLNYFRIAKQVLHNDEDPSSPSPIAPPLARPAESVHEQESAAEEESPAEVSAESEADLLDAAVNSEKAKEAGLRLWPRIVKHSGAGLLWVSAFYESHQFGFIVVVLVLIAGLLWLIYHNRKRLKTHLIKWLK